MKEIIITESLQETVRTHPNVKEIHFDAQGRHYFNVHQLPASKDDKEKRSYGAGMFSHRQVIPGMHNIENRTEEISKGDPSTLIVKTMTRSEVLESSAKKEGDAIAAQIMNSTPEDKNIIMASLFDADTLAALAMIKSGKVKLVAVEEEVEEPEER